MAALRRMARQLFVLWIVLAVLGVFLIAAQVPVVRGAVSGFLNADLATRDQLSSTYSFAVGVGSLVVSIAAFALQPRRATPVAPDPSPVGSAPIGVGMGTLAVPMFDPADRVRGRSDLVGELLALFGWRTWQGSRVRVLYGTAGGGKTTVAQQVALKAQERGVEVWWVSAAEYTDLQTGMRLLARRLGATSQELEQEWADHAPDVLWRRLSAYHGRWLLVVDNADDPRILAPQDEPVAHQRGWIRPPATRQGAVILTSRDSTATTWGSWCQLHEVAMLSPTDGAQVLFDHVQGDEGDRPEAEALSVRLGGLPLALTLAGRYLADANQVPLPGSMTSFTEYREALDGAGLTAVFADRVDRLSFTEARQVIARTWELSLGLLADRGLPQARPLLRLLATFADAPIPYQEILDPVVLGVSTRFDRLGFEQIRGLLHGLASLGLIELTSMHDETTVDTSTPIAIIRLHPLVRDASRYHLISTQQYSGMITLAADLLQHVCASIDPETPRKWPVWHLLVPHAMHLLVSTSQAGTASPEALAGVTEVAARACQFLRHIGLFATAQAQGMMILDAVAPVLGLEAPAVLTVRTDLAACVGDGGAREEARDQLADIQLTCDRVLGREHPDSLRVKIELAIWTGRAGDAAAARNLFVELVPLCQRVLGPTHPQTLTAQHNLAAWTGQAGDPVEARDQMVILLPIRQFVLGEDHPDTLHTRHNLATWTGLAGDPESARDQFTALLVDRERVLGAEHPSTLANRAGLAIWTGMAGDASAARDQFLELLPIRQRLLGPDHPHTLTVREAIATWSARC